MLNCRTRPLWKLVIAGAWRVLLLQGILLWAPVGAAPGDAGSGFLTNISQVGQTPHERRTQGLPVRLKGVITFHDPDSDLTFFQDETGGMELRPQSEARFVVGQEAVEVEGLVTNSWIDGKITSLGIPASFEPSKVLLKDLLSGASGHAHFVEAKGLVRSAAISNGRLSLEIWNGGLARLRVVNFARDGVSQYAGTEVRFRAVAGALRKDSAGRDVREMWAQSETNIVIERTNVVAAEEVSNISAISDADAGRKVRLKVEVVTYAPLDKLVVKDKTGTLTALADAPGTDVYPGDEIALEGFVLRKDAALQLEHSSWTWLRSPEVAAPVVSPGFPGGANPLAPLTTVQAVRRLSVEQARLSYPVEVRATITYYDTNWNLAFIQDPTSGIFLNLNGNRTPAQAGDVALIKAVSTPGDFAPALSALEIKVLWHGKTTPAQIFPLGELLTGQQDSQWVGIKGIVRAVMPEPPIYRFRLATPTGTFLGITPAQITSDLVDAEVLLEGACGSEFNKNRQFKGINLFIPTTNHIKVLQRGVPNPFATPQKKIADVGRFDLGETFGHRCRVQGIVTHIGPNNEIYLQDDSAGVLALPKGVQNVKVGNLADVVGFPELGRYTPILQEAVLRDLGPAPAVQPFAIVARDPLDPGKPVYDARLVEIEGTVVDNFLNSEGQSILLNSSSNLFKAVLQGRQSPGSEASLRKGALVRVRGVCAMELDSFQQARGFNVLLRSVDDVKVLTKAPWWTSPNLARALGALGCVAVLFAGWVLILRRRVRQQTEHIHQHYRLDALFATLDRRLSRASTPVEAAQVILEVAHQMIPCTAARLDLLTLEGRRCEPVLALGASTLGTYPVLGHALNKNWAGVQEVMRDGRLHLIGGAAAVMAFAADKPAAGLLSVAIESQKRMSGIISVQLGHSRTNSLADLELLFKLAQNCTSALDRIRAEEASRQNELRFQMAARAASDVIWDWEIATDRLWIGEGAARLIGEKPQVGHEFWEKYLDPEDRERIIVEREAACAGKASSWSGEYRLRGVDGGEVYVFDRAQVIRNASGEAIRMIGAMQDITQRKSAEIELQRAKSAAEQANRAKSEFLANMSHEIRTPMNGIIGMSNLLLETPMDSEQRECAETVRNSAEALLTIINDILDFSKIEAGKLAFDNVDFNLRDVVEDTVELLAERARNKGLELAAFLPDDVHSQLRGDPGRLRQVLINLLGNAVKFTDKGEVFVNVSQLENNTTHVRLKIEVIDMGIGVSEEIQRKLFQSFTQADGSTTRRFGGTGLGLAICRQLVQLMHGEIGVISKVGQGSNFWFTVVLEKQIGLAGTPPADVRALEGLRLLVVDDNATNRKILHHQIVSWKMRNGSVESGPEALKLLRERAALGEPYDLAILDMQMPDMDGLMLARAIKKDPVIAGVRLIMLTSLGRKLPEETLREHGILCCLLKPARQSELYNALLKAVNDQPIVIQRPPLRSIEFVERADESEKGKRVRLLLAEDNVVNQKVALRQLKKLGYAADVVANGLEVLEACQRTQYPLILMDCHMPEMDGYEATRRIREMETQSAEGRPYVPTRIIALTADAMQGDREKCLALGMDDYISKPVKIEDLKAVLEKHLAIFSGSLAKASRTTT